MTRNCRLLYLVGQLRPGGLERQLYFLLQGMDRQVYRPEVVVWNFHPSDPYVQQIRDLGVPVHPFPREGSRTARVRAFRDLVRQIAPEVVHSYSFYTNPAAWWATAGTSIVAIGAVQGDFIRDKKCVGVWVGSLSARWPRVQIFNSVTAAQNARNSRSVFRPQVVCVVRNGLDLNYFRSIPLSAEVPPQILGVGSLFAVKRWDRLIRAAAELKRRSLDFHLRVAGGGPLHESLAKLALDLGVAESVELIGHSDAIPSLIEHSSFVAHTSDSEGCPNVVMEAMACGRAVVATNVGDVPSLVDDGRTGFVVRRGDDAALIERMSMLIKDRDLCRRMGEAGRVKAEREFGIDRLVSETLAVYRSAGWSDS